MAGVRYFLLGIGWVARRQWLFGLIPALIVLVVYVVALVVLARDDCGCGEGHECTMANKLWP